MVSYGIVVLPLIKHLKAELTNITQPWYADNAGAIGTFTNVKLYFNCLKQFGPGRGCHPKLSKSVLIVPPVNIEAKKRFGLSHGFKI